MQCVAELLPFTILSIINKLFRFLAPSFFGFVNLFSVANSVYCSNVFFSHFFGHYLLGSYRACRTMYIGRHVNIDRVEILFMGHHIKTIFFNTNNLLKVWQSFRNPFGSLNQWWCLLLFATGMNRDQGYNPAPIYGTILQFHQNGAANNSKRHQWVGSESSV